MKTRKTVVDVPLDFLSCQSLLLYSILKTVCVFLLSFRFAIGRTSEDGVAGENKDEDHRLRSRLRAGLTE